MSIFSKSIADITWDDLNELLREFAKESVRLEFKREIPGKDETLKKLSSFANTYGGYMVIGAAEDGNGNIAALDGVDLQPNFDQTIFQWCFEGVYSPIVPVVSKPISVATNPSKCLYVIYVEESGESPHFLNARKGCFVRTDEYSQRFEPRLAKMSEIEFLQNRRQRSLQLREFLFNRAHQRFYKHVGLSSKNGNDSEEFKKSSFALSVIPRFPGLMMIDVKKLREIVNSSSFSARQTRFPSGRIESQPEGFYFLNPRQLGLSYLEVDIHGFLYYRQELTPEKVDKQNPQSPSFYIRVSHIFAWVILYLKYASKLYQESGYDGTLYIRILLENITGIQFMMPFEISTAEAPRLDNSIQIEDECSSLVLRKDLVAQLKRIYRNLCFSYGHQGAYDASDHSVEEWIKPCLGYLMWNSLD